MSDKIKLYERKAFYYETDKMGIVHHSNYIRWFEETRVHYLNEVGFPYAKMEELGVMIPVLSASVEYKNAVFFDETVIIVPKVEAFNGFKLHVSYRVIGKEKGDLKATGETSHFFTDMNLKPIRVKRAYPDIYKAFADNIGVDFMELMEDNDKND